MRSGEAIVGSITAGYEGFGNRIARLMIMDQVVCYNVDCADYLCCRKVSAW